MYILFGRRNGVRQGKKNDNPTHVARAVKSFFRLFWLLIAAKERQNKTKEHGLLVVAENPEFSINNQGATENKFVNFCVKTFRRDFLAKCFLWCF
jgi:hypothetical protein